MSIPLPSVLKGLAALSVGIAAGYQFFSTGTTRKALLRPPGALDEPEFLSHCLRCGKCGLACPYRVIKYDDSLSQGTPYLIAREGPCRLCDDFPCIAACPSAALAPVADKRAVKMGIAVIDRDLCIALQGMRCEVCYRVCPLIDEAISIEYSLRKGDSHHAIFEPVINAEKCVGCGICEERCIISDPVAIYMKPRGS
ncbi:MAG: 4Fe-4S dicluster domain-containing protein [Coriobacteriia bacterium]|jgi:ferredoxin-type protein NapG|nr:4Fe-4S dicluster domain-containing protein [Coriobacteriia bacterium]